MVKINWQIGTSILLGAACLVNAHLVAGSLKPAGGETLATGSSDTITWTEQFNHGGTTDIAFSKDGGKTWSPVKTGFKDAQGVNKFVWSVPTDQTTTGKIRICQEASQVPCTDANNTSMPSGNGGNAPYILVSGAFTVTSGSSIRTVEAADMAPSLRYNADTRNLDVTFGIAQDQDVSILAYDAQGRVMATLLERKQTAGSHHLSIFSNRLSGAGALVFQFKAGDQVHSQVWNAVR